MNVANHSLHMRMTTTDAGKGQEGVGHRRNRSNAADGEGLAANPVQDNSPTIDNKSLSAARPANSTSQRNDSTNWSGIVQGSSQRQGNGPAAQQHSGTNPESRDAGAPGSSMVSTPAPRNRSSGCNQNHSSGAVEQEEGKHIEGSFSLGQGSGASSRNGVQRNAQDWGSIRGTLRSGSAGKGGPGNHSSASALPSSAAYAAQREVNSSSPASSPAAVYLKVASTWLVDSELQVIFAACALLLGILFAWNGPELWPIMFPALASALAAAIAAFEAGTRDFDQSSTITLVIQVAAIFALATYSGFEGSQVLLGALLGLWTATCCGGWVEPLDEQWVPGLVILWNSLGGVLGVLVLTVWRAETLVTLGSLLGGFLAATGLGSLASYACEVALGTGNLPPLPPSTAPWVASSAVALGVTGPGLAVVGHGACAAVAVMIHRRWRDRRHLAVACLISYLAVIVVSTLAGDGCEGLQGGVSCLPWTNGWGMHHWTWPTCCCSLWMALSAMAAWRQLGWLQASQARSAWHCKGEPEWAACKSGYESDASWHEPPRGRPFDTWS